LIISYLADHEDLIPEVAQLHFNEWGHFRPGDTVEARAARLKLCCGKGRIPSVLVGFLGSELCGAAMLVESDMESRPDLGPWLAGVVVKPEHRGKSLGTALVQAIVSEAQALGIPQLYLYTDASQSLYARLGWLQTERCDYKGIEVSIMCKELVPNNSFKPKPLRGSA
jgi:GNAT superfamily N-acetyltransferase